MARAASSFSSPGYAPRISYALKMSGWISNDVASSSQLPASSSRLPELGSDLDFCVPEQDLTHCRKNQDLTPPTRPPASRRSRVCSKLVAGSFSKLTVVRDGGLVAEDDAVLHRHAAPDVAVTSDDRPADHRFLADPRVRPDNGVLDHRLILEIALPSD